MSEKIELHQLLGDTRRSYVEQLRIFALLNLGILESLSHGMISADDAVASFFHGENCSFVHAHMRSRTADELMSRGVQLPDLFDALPATIAQREFQRETRQDASVVSISAGAGAGTGGDVPSRNSPEVTVQFHCWTRKCIKCQRYLFPQFTMGDKYNCWSLRLSTNLIACL